MENAESAVRHFALTGAAMAGAFTTVPGLFPVTIFSALGAAGRRGPLRPHRFRGRIRVLDEQHTGRDIAGHGRYDYVSAGNHHLKPRPDSLSGALTVGWGPIPATGIAGPVIAMVLSMAGSALCTNGKE